MRPVGHRSRRTIAVGGISLIAGLLPAMSPLATSVSAAAPTVVNTLVNGSPVEVDATPPGVGEIVGQVAGHSNVWQRLANGTVQDLGEGEAPKFFLGDDTAPLLVGSVAERAGSDLNSDGDNGDIFLAVSGNGAQFLPLSGAPVAIGHAIGFTGLAGDCLVRINSSLAVACESEDAGHIDLNSDGDYLDVGIVLIHSSGTINRTGVILDDVPTLGPEIIELPDGSLSVGTTRVGPNGALSTVSGLPGGVVVAMLESNLIVHQGTEFFFVPPMGPPTNLNAAAVHQVGTSVWVGGGELCRLHADLTRSCLGIIDQPGANWSFHNPSPTFIVLDDDAALVVGHLPVEFSAKTTRIFLVRAGQMPEEIGGADDTSDLGNGRALTYSSCCSAGLRGSFVTTSGVIGFSGADNFLPLADGRAVVQLREGPSIDYNGDGDTNDAIAHLFTGSTLVNLGVDVSGASALPDGNGVLLAVDEVGSGDRNGDGDALDAVAAVFDGAVVVNLGRAVGAGDGTDARLVGTNGNTGLFGVSEVADGHDLDNSSTIDGVVTFAMSYAPVATPPPVATVSPTRLLDTRVDGPQVGYSGAKPVAGQIIEVGAPAGSTAVVMNVTGTNVSEAGFVTAYPCGQPIPGTSNLNLTAGLDTANMVISKVGANGKVCLYTQRSVDLIADLSGSLASTSPYTAVMPARLLDTRPESDVNYGLGPPFAGWDFGVQVPAGAAAVALNVTAVDSAGGYVTVYPCGAPRPNVSSLNLTPGSISANLTITRPGVDNKVCIYTLQATHIVVDMVGTFSVDPSQGTQQRVLDTRADSLIGYTGSKPVTGQTIEVTAPSGADSVVLNVTGLDAEQEGFVTVYPCGTTRPIASTLNLTPGRITPNLTITKVGANGKVCIFTQRSANLIADLMGSFPAG